MTMYILYLHYVGASKTGIEKNCMEYSSFSENGPRGGVAASCISQERRIVCQLGRSNLSKSGPYEPTFFSWMGVHALMAVRTLILSLVKYPCDAVDLCETAQLPL